MNNNVPRMFRAQIEGRCQIQRLPQAREDAYDWVDEWVKGASPDVLKFSVRICWRDYRISWRFISNSGQDESVIRPVIGAKGYPYYPGSSMKGAFLRMCSPEEAIIYCGNETQPGILRFHGGYPKDNNWRNGESKDRLVDVVHPQESWQVEEQAEHSAFVQISLYQPTLVFGISSNQDLDETEWEKIWEIWKKALNQGIGTRVSAGYGRLKSHKENRLCPPIHLKGEGLASQLINGKGELRPNMFKAALRGHTLRLFGGVTDEATAQKLTKKLWGGFNGNSSYVGKLGIAFNAVEKDVFPFTFGNSELPVYDLKQGNLEILCMSKIPDKERAYLKTLIVNIVKFSMLLGGFCKSWRRVDHRLFFQEYFKSNNKPMIGCHWEFIEYSEKLYIPVNNLSDLTNFLNNLQLIIKRHIRDIEKEKLVKQPTGWREAWHPKKVQVWGRIADNYLDSQAVYWFHDDYQEGKTIKNSDLTGKISKVGRIWHRMYPCYIGEKKQLVSTKQYVELLTIFPDDSTTTNDFLDYLKNASDFEKLWKVNQVL